MTREEIIEECKQRLGFETDYETYSLCQHEKDFYNAIIKELEQQSDDCVSRQEVIRIAEQGQVQGFEWQIKKLVALPPVTPTHGTCKNCKHCEDISKDVFKIYKNSYCLKQGNNIYRDDFYCASYEKRGSENE